MRISPPVPDSDTSTLGIYRSAAGLLLGAGGLSALIVPFEPGLTKRHRIVAGTWAASTIGMGLFARHATSAATRIGRSHTEIVATGLLVGGSLGTMFGGGYRSPAFFASLATTAVGAGLVGPIKGGKYGAAAAGLYGLGVVGTARPWRQTAPPILWNASVLPAFWSAGHIGSLLGDLALTFRSLEVARRRDLETLRRLGTVQLTGDELRRRAGVVGEAASELRGSILRLAVGARREGLVDERLDRAAAANADGLRHLLIAPTLLGMAHRKTGRLDEQVAEVVATQRSDRLQIVVRLDSELPASIDPRSAGTLLEILKRGIDNAAAAKSTDQGVTVHVRLDVTNGPGGVRLHLAIEDDARGEVPPESQWGFGLRRSVRDARELGGDLRIQRAAAGLRLLLELPSVPQTPAEDDAGSAGAHLDRTVSEGFEVLRLANAAQAALQVFQGVPTRVGVRRLVRIAILVALGEASIRKEGKASTWGVPAVAFLSSACFPGRGKPVSMAWTAAMCADHAFRRRSLDAIPAIATAASILTAGPRRALTSELPITVADRLFPLVTAFIAVATSRGGQEVRDREHELGSLVDRLGLIEAITRPLANKHDILEQLWKSGVLLELRRLADDDRLPEYEQTLNAARRLTRAGSDLEELLTVTEAPVDLLREQLEVQLAPAAIDFVGTDVLEDMTEERRSAAWSLDRGRDRLWLVQLADEIAQEVRRQVPPTMLGRQRLRRVVVAFAADGEYLRLTVRPLPASRRSPSAGPGRLDRIARRLDGRLAEGFDDGMLAIRIRPSVFL